MNIAKQETSEKSKNYLENLCRSLSGKSIGIKESLLYAVHSNISILYTNVIDQFQELKNTIQFFFYFRNQN